MTDPKSKLPSAPGSSDEQITVVIPAYDEEHTIAGVISGVRKHVVSHPLNKGNGAAIKTALRAIPGGRVAVIDGDGQHDPEDLPRLLAGLEEYDLVVGARTFTGRQGSRLRNLGNLFLRRLASFLAEQSILDLTSGFRAFRHSVACKFLHMYPNGFSFPCTSTLSLIAAGYSVDFIPIRVRSRPSNTESKLHPFRDGFLFVQFMLRVITVANPNKIFFPAGLVLVLIGIALTFRNLILFAQFSGGVVLFLAGGINIIFFGLILDQFATLRLQERD
jgi:glycosyltransferase involved in cell wall biosynthesis